MTSQLQIDFCNEILDKNFLNRFERGRQEYMSQNLEWTENGDEKWFMNRRFINNDFIFFVSLTDGNIKKSVWIRGLYIPAETDNNNQSSVRLQSDKYYTSGYNFYNFEVHNVVLPFEEDYLYILK
jgi:hypothetical protein